MLDTTLTIVLAGGVGSRLHPLTAERAKPAVPFGGKYRIIDFALSNCYHSGLRRILVLTQYKSHSLQKHLRDAWSIFNPGIGEYITPVPPQMRTGESWYKGTADAVYQNQYLLERSGAEHVLILSGDHIYRMDYAAMLACHEQHAADATVACMKVTRDEARAFGVLGLDRGSRVVEFAEKPAEPKCVPGDPDHALVSMGVYVFSLEVLREFLEEDAASGESSHDFGKDILPRLIQSHKVIGYEFGGSTGRVTADGYWRDVGTVEAYFEANMDLLHVNPQIDLYQRDWAIRTVEGQGPPARTVPGPAGRESEITNAMLSSGTVVAGARVDHSILSRGVFVEEDAVISESILFDGVRIGRGARLRRAIVDKEVHVPPGEQIGIDLERDRKRFTVSESGIVVVPKHYVFQPESIRVSTTNGSRERAAAFSRIAQTDR